LHHQDKLLHRAECVSITFEFQKRDTKNDVITQFCSPDALLCPVKIWTRIVRRILSYPSPSPDSTVNCFQLPDGTLSYFTGKELLSRIRLVAESIGKDELGFSANELGLHSARSGAAMAMYLAKVPVYTIMLLGHWSSDAFLRYIRRQVKEFSKGVSQRMIMNEKFFTISSNVRPEDVPEDCPLNSKFGSMTFRDTIIPLAKVFQN